MTHIITVGLLGGMLGAILPWCGLWVDDKRFWVLMVWWIIASNILLAVGGAK